MLFDDLKKKKIKLLVRLMSVHGSTASALPSSTSRSKPSGTTTSPSTGLQIHPILIKYD